MKKIDLGRRFFAIFLMVTMILSGSLQGMNVKAQPAANTDDVTQKEEAASEETTSGSP